VLEARHPTSRHGNLTDQQGHDLGLELEALLTSAHLLAAQLHKPRPINERTGRPPLVDYAGATQQERDKHLLPLGISEERKTGFEPATLTLERCLNSSTVS
jgi:hypothetical protein